MKKIFLFQIIFVALSLQGYAQNSLIITAPGGSTKGIVLSGLKRITFASGTMNVLKSDASVESFLLTDISKMTFGLVSDAPEVPSSSCVFYPTVVETYLHCEGLSGDGKHNVAIFSLDGQRLRSAMMTGSVLLLDMSHLTSGVYLVTIDGVVRKVIKK